MTSSSATVARILTRVAILAAVLAVCNISSPIASAASVWSGGAAPKFMSATINIEGQTPQAAGQAIIMVENTTIRVSADTVDTDTKTDGKITTQVPDMAWVN